MQPVRAHSLIMTWGRQFNRRNTLKINELPTGIPQKSETNYVPRAVLDPPALVVNGLSLTTACPLFQYFFSMWNINDKNGSPFVVP